MDVAACVENVRSRIAAAAKRAGRDPDAVRLVAVSKYQPVALVQEAVHAGVSDFGENYVQELERKRGELSIPMVRWHLVGHLQSNKARVAATVANVVQSVDSEKLALELSKRCEQAGRVIDIFLQVNIGREPQKGGVLPEATRALVARCRDLSGVRLVGLMCIPPADMDARPFFRAMRGLAEAAHVEQLSMGMSDDFELAIEEGATLVRVGTAIFGARPQVEAAPA